MINMYRLPILLILNDIVSCGSWIAVINVQVEQGRPDARARCALTQGPTLEHIWPHTGAYMPLNTSVN
jgi:hypothetical protein